MTVVCPICGQSYTGKDLRPGPDGDVTITSGQEQREAIERWLLDEICKMSESVKAYQRMLDDASDNSIALNDSLTDALVTIAVLRGELAVCARKHDKAVIDAAVLRTALIDAVCDPDECACRCHGIAPKKSAPPVGGEQRSESARTRDADQDAPASSAPAHGVAGSAKCGARDEFSPRVCDKPWGHDGCHEDSRYPVGHDWSTTHCGSGVVDA